MRIEIRIIESADGQDKVLARESIHVTDVSPARRHLAQHIASVAAQLLSGERIVTKELPEHFKD